MDHLFGNGFVLDGSSVWQELKLEPCSSKVRVTNPDYWENCGIHSNGGIGCAREAIGSEEQRPRWVFV
jgi:hypothetical protein